jgi:hypothetical protein
MIVRAGSVAAVVALAAACSTSASRADNTALCSGVAADLKGAGLNATPSQEQARAAGGRLDARLTQVADPGLHEAVIRLHQHVHDIEVGWRKAGAGAARVAAARARGDAEKAARLCQLPPDAFLQP